MSCIVKLHRIVRAIGPELPRRDDLAARAVCDRNLTGIRDVYEYSGTIPFELERLGMTGKRDVAQAVASPSVDDPDRAAAVSHVDSIRLCVVPDVVGVTGESQSSQVLKRHPVEHVARAVAAVGNEEACGSVRETETLWLAEPTKTPFPPSRPKVDNFNRPVSECGDEEPLSLRIDRHMVDATFDPGERDRLNEPQRVFAARPLCGHAAA